MIVTNLLWRVTLLVLLVDVSCNYKINKNLAIELNKIFLEVIIANGFDNNAFKILR